MTKRNSIPPLKEEVAGWRHALHENPAIMYEEVFASDLIAGKLTEWGIPFKRGLGKTGIVAIIEGKKNTSNKTIGLRADMDALPINESSGQPWSSKIPGRMHACGHDGHTSILLGTAKYLNETKNFDGRAMMIFQPAEEGGRGAFAMMKDGLFKDELKCDAVYGLHNWPQLPIGTAGIRPGPVMAAVDTFVIEIAGIGGHAAYPSRCVDPIVIGAILVNALQNILSRMIAPQDMAVLSITNFHSGTGASNVIPDLAKISGTVRSFKPEVRDTMESRIKKMSTEICSAYGAKVSVDYEREIDATINNPEHTQICIEAMGRIIGIENVNTDIQPSLGGEDFGGMLMQVPGAYIHLGQGAANPESPHNRSLHRPHSMISTTKSSRLAWITLLNWSNPAFPSSKLDWSNDFGFY